MRKLLIGLSFGIAAVSGALAQQFDTPLDLVETLYGSYFDALPIADFAPYFSDDLTRQLAGTVGVSEFEALGFDPIVSDPNWEPRDFSTVTLLETHDRAQVLVGFETRRTPVSIKISLVREPLHGWQIDHIAGSAGDRTWCTNTIIALHPTDRAAP